MIKKKIDINQLEELKNARKVIFCVLGDILPPKYHFEKKCENGQKMVKKRAKNSQKRAKKPDF